MHGQSIFVIHTWFVAVQSVCGVCMQIFKRRDKCIYISISHTLSGSIFHRKFSAQSKISGRNAYRIKECQPRKMCVKLVQVASLHWPVLGAIPDFALIEFEFTKYQNSWSLCPLALQDPELTHGLGMAKGDGFEDLAP